MSTFAEILLNAVADSLDDRSPDAIEEELIDLTLAVAAINTWNRFNIAFRTPAGSYQPGQFASAAS